MRLDKWLWHARFTKSRSLASKLISTSGVRVNGVRISKPAHIIAIGDVLTFALGTRVLVVRICDLGTRRGPAVEAQGLYQDLSPPPPAPDLSRPVPIPGGRPSKQDRRRYPPASSDALD